MSRAAEPEAPDATPRPVPPLGAVGRRLTVLAVAAELLEVSPDDLSLADDTVRVAGAPERQLSLRRVAEAASRAGRQIIGRGQAPDANDPPFAAQFAEVEVDLETGVVRVLRLVSAHDVGRAINPTIVEGQVEGALQQGLGYALYEDMPLDPTSGAARAVTFADYRMPTAEAMPRIDVLLIADDPAGDGPFGAKAIGEPGLVPTAAAIANAIHDAVGVWLTELPITPERVLAARRAAYASVPARGGRGPT